MTVVSKESDIKTISGGNLVGGIFLGVWGGKGVNKEIFEKPDGWHQEKQRWTWEFQQNPKNSKDIKEHA